MKVLLFLLLPLISVGQGLTGTVVNSETKEGVPFATIGLVKQNTGTNADEKGHFTLNTTPAPNDSFIVSSVGYETLKIAADNTTSGIKFELKPKVATLKEVIVEGNYQWKRTTLGQSSDCGSHYYTTGTAINQVAQHFKAAEANTYLSEVEICKYGIAIIDPARTKFRIRIYSMDTVTRQPSIELCNKIIELDVSGRRVKVNLDKYNIFIPGQDFFVAVEWLRIPLNEQKSKTRLDGRNIVVYSTYTPLLAIKEVENSNWENWHLDYTGKWHKFRWKLMISATVKY
jgi:hypothetical protein